MKHGKLFVLEGPDGVGKTTLAHYLVSYLRSVNEPAIYRAFPGRAQGTLGYLVYELHHSPTTFGIGGINSASLQMLHVAAHIDEVSRAIFPALESGSHVILDRYWWSTWAYGLVSGVPKSFLEALRDLELGAWQGIEPAAIFCITRHSPLRETEELEVWVPLCQAYDELADAQARSQNVCKINNDGAIGDTLQKAVEIIGQHTILQSQTSAPQLKLPLPELARVDPRSESTAGAATKPAAKRMEDVPLPVAVFSRLSPARPTPVLDTYWRFAAERQAIFFRKLRGEPAPHTDDPILRQYKFTNAYRASDRVSQYLIQHVIYEGDQSPTEVFFRVVIFKIFNRISTWDLLRKELGDIRYADYSFARYDALLTHAIEEGARLFSAAYIMPSGSGDFTDTRKHRSYLRLVEKMMHDSIVASIQQARSMRRVFELLHAYPMIGDFLAYQYATDINYSELTNFNEMDVVVPGPGARSGLRKCFSSFGGLNEADMIRLMADIQESEFNRLGLRFESLWGRPLQLIDCQNVFCEVDKYARHAHPSIKGASGRTRIKQLYRPSPDRLRYWYPPSWGINHLIPTASRGAPRVSSNPVEAIVTGGGDALADDS